MKTSSLFLMLRSRAIATLAGAAIVGWSGLAGAQVVEDKNPVPAPNSSSADDAVKDASKSAADTAKQAGDSAKQTADSAAKSASDTAKQATDTAKQATSSAQQTAGSAAQQAADTTKQAGETAKQAGQTARQATNNAADTAAGAANKAADSAGNAAKNAAGTANNAVNNAAGAANNAVNNAAGAVNNAAGNVNASGRVNAGAQAGSTSVNAQSNTAVGADVGRVAAQTGLNFAADAANALTLSTVARNSIFANAGFQPNDQFVSIGGQPIANQAAFYRYLGTVPVGQRVPIVVMRNGQQQTIYWTPDQRFVQMQPTFRTFVEAARPVAGGNMLGIHLDPSVTDAAIVASVEEGSQAANAGVRQGDQIVALNDQEVQNPQQFEQAASQMAPNAPARIAVARTVELQAGAVRQTGVTVTTSAPAAVQPGVVDPRPAAPVGPVRRFRFR